MKILNKLKQLETCTHSEVNESEHRSSNTTNDLFIAFIVKQKRGK
jgi:hypothetical protein